MKPNGGVIDGESPLTKTCSKIKSLACRRDGCAGVGFPLATPKPVPDAKKSLVETRAGLSELPFAFFFHKQKHMLR
jgi:hypothetical protein